VPDVPAFNRLFKQFFSRSIERRGGLYGAALRLEKPFVPADLFTLSTYVAWQHEVCLFSHVA